MSPPRVVSYPTELTVCKVCRHTLHFVGFVLGRCMVRSRYFLHLIGPIFQEVMGDPIQPREEKKEESPEEGSCNKGRCVLKQIVAT